MTVVIELTQNQSTLVDSEDFEKLSRYKWCAGYDKHIKGYYAMSRLPIKNGKQKTIRMHRIIMNAPKNIQIDHINHDTLDNRKKNLRLCTNSQNHMNQKPTDNSASKYKGVSWEKKNSKWKAQIEFNSKNTHIGYFNYEIKAAKAYNKKARELFGKFALLNKVQE